MESTLNSVPIFTRFTYIICLYVIYQILPCGASSIRRFPCDKDRCERGVQYCVKEEHRCYYCKDIVQYCDTNELPLQCDSFCKEKSLNATFEDNLAALNHKRETSMEQYNRGYEIAIPFLGLLVGLLTMSIFVILLVYKYKRFHPDERSPKEKDIETTSLIANNHNSDEGANQECNQDGLNVDEKEAPAPTDVTPHDEDQSRRDSQVSKDSAMESLGSENVQLDEGTKENEECSPKTNIENGSGKRGGPPRDNLGTGSDSANIDGRQNTRNINPTTGENAASYEVVVNSSGLSPLHKLYIDCQTC